VRNGLQPMDFKQDIALAKQRYADMMKGKK
jgi:hypothetical protein